MVEDEGQILPFKQHIPRYPGGDIDPENSQKVPAETYAPGMPSARTSFLFRPDQRGTEVGEAPKSQKIGFYMIGSKPVTTKYGDEYFNPDEAYRETDKLDELIKDAERLAYAARANIVDSDYRKLEGLEKQRTVAMRMLKSANDQSINIFQSARWVVGLSAAVVHHDIVRKILHLEHQNGLHNRDRFYALEDYNHSGLAQVSIGGFSPIDFIDQRPSVRPDSLSGIRLLVTAQTMYETRNYQESLTATEGELLQLFPNKTLNYIAVATRAMIDSLDATPQIIDRSIHPDKKKDKTVIQIVTVAKKFIARSKELGKEVTRIITNPAHPQFRELRQELAGYMAEGRLQELQALSVFGIKDPDQAKSLYRDVRKLATKFPVQWAFFTDLAEAIRDFQIEIPDGYGILTTDDIPTFVDEEVVGSEQTTKVADIQQSVDHLPPSAYKENYSIDPDKIEWGALVKARKVSITFDRTKQKNFTANLTYEGSTGESAVIKVEYKLQKNVPSIDLNFLESSDEIPQLYQAVISVMQLALKDVSAQSQQKKIADRPQSSAQVSKQEKRPLIEIQPAEIELAQIKDKIKTRPEHPVETAEEPVSELDLEFEGSQLVMDDVSLKRFEKKLARLRPEDGNSIRETMGRFNRGEPVKFYPLKRRGRKGEVLFSLRAKATVRGDSRILVTPIKGTPDFAVLDVDYRKDIYRNWDV